jgi:hypothetical protein
MNKKKAPKPKNSARYPAIEVGDIRQASTARAMSVGKKRQSAKTPVGNNTRQQKISVCMTAGRRKRLPSTADVHLGPSANSAFRKPRILNQSPPSG